MPWSQKKRNKHYEDTRVSLHSSWITFSLAAGVLYVGLMIFIDPSNALTTYFAVKWGLLLWFSVSWWKHPTFMNHENRKGIILVIFFVFVVFFIVGLEKGAVSFARNFTSGLFIKWERYPTFLPYLGGSIFTLLSTSLYLLGIKEVLRLTEKHWARVDQEEIPLPGWKETKKQEGLKEAPPLPEVNIFK